MNNPYIPVALRRRVIERARGQCEYCQTPALYSPDIFEVEHVIPESQGGLTTLDNLAFACSTCNRCKAARRVAADPVTGKNVPLFNPRRQRWHRHLCWSADSTQIIGLTATGRATVEALRMNRPSIRRFRAALLAVGLHPAQER